LTGSAQQGHHIIARVPVVVPKPDEPRKITFQRFERLSEPSFPAIPEKPKTLLPRSARRSIAAVAWAGGCLKFDSAGTHRERKGLCEAVYTGWFETLADPTHSHNYPKNDNQGLYAIVFRNQAALGSLTGWIWFVGSCLSGIAWVATVLSIQRDRFELGLLAMVPFILWAAPLSWIHHQIWLWPVLAVCLKKPNWILLTVVWLLLNGTGDLFWSREWFARIYQWGVPTLAFPLTQYLFFQYIRGSRNVEGI